MGQDGILRQVVNPPGAPVANRRGESIQVDEGGSATVSLKRISSAEMTDTL
ncbi:MAG: hypothetical protein ABSF25_07065 [Bryobacteraceae bacterium]